MKLLASLLLCSALLGCGVSSFREALDSVHTPYTEIDTSTADGIQPPTTRESTPADDVVTGATKVITNPTSIDGWSALATGLATIGLTLTGVWVAGRQKKRKQAQLEEAVKRISESTAE